MLVLKVRNLDLMVAGKLFLEKDKRKQILIVSYALNFFFLKKKIDCGGRGLCEVIQSRESRKESSVLQRDSELVLPRVF